MNAVHIIHEASNMSCDVMLKQRHVSETVRGLVSAYSITTEQLRR